MSVDDHIIADHAVADDAIRPDADSIADPDPAFEYDVDVDFDILPYAFKGATHVEALRITQGDAMQHDPLRPSRLIHPLQMS